METIAESEQPKPVGLSTKRLHGAFYGIAVAVILFDQVTKSLVRANLDMGQSFPVEGFFRITHIANSGAAFGLFSNQGIFLSLTAAIGIIALLVYHRAPYFSGFIPKLSLGLQLGGAMGNLVDRLRLGSVTDFVDLRIWPVFNLADTAIVLGVILLAFYVAVIHREPAPEG